MIEDDLGRTTLRSLGRTPDPTRAPAARARSGSKSSGKQSTAKSKSKKQGKVAEQPRGGFVSNWLMPACYSVVITAAFFLVYIMFGSLIG